MLSGWFGHILQEYLLPHEWSYLHYAHDARQIPYFTEPQFVEFLKQRENYEFTRDAIAHATLDGFLSVLDRVTFSQWSFPHIRNLKTLIWYERKGWMYDSQYELLNIGQVDIDVLAYLEIAHADVLLPIPEGKTQNIQWLFDRGYYDGAFYERGVSRVCEQNGDLSSVDVNRLTVYVGFGCELSLWIYKHQTPTKRAWMESTIAMGHYYLYHIEYLKLVPHIGWNDLFLKLAKTKDDVEYLQNRFGMCPFIPSSSPSKITLTLYDLDAALWTKDVKLNYNILWNFAISDKDTFDLLMGSKSCQQFVDMYKGNDLQTWRLIWDRCETRNQKTTFPQNNALLNEMTHRDIKRLIHNSKDLKLYDCTLDAMKLNMLQPYLRFREEVEE